MPGLIVTIGDPSATARAPDQRLREVFGLTPAQALVAGRLADGCTLAQIAGALSISRNTARRHLAAAVSRTGTRCQAELVRLLVQQPN